MLRKLVFYEKLGRCCGGINPVLVACCNRGSLKRYSKMPESCADRRPKTYDTQNLHYESTNLEAEVDHGRLTTSL